MPDPTKRQASISTRTARGGDLGSFLPPEPANSVRITDRAKQRPPIQRLTQTCSHEQDGEKAIDPLLGAKHPESRTQGAKDPHGDFLA